MAFNIAVQDLFLVYDGIAGPSPILFGDSGTILPGPITSTGNILAITLVSDNDGVTGEGVVLDVVYGKFQLSMNVFLI